MMGYASNEERKAWRQTLIARGKCVICSVNRADPGFKTCLSCRDRAFSYREEKKLGGFSVECDCGAWFLGRSSYKDHCKSTGHIYAPERVGPSPVAKNLILVDIQDPKKEYGFGDIITDHRNVEWILKGFKGPSAPGADGKVHVERIDSGVPISREFYARIFGCEVRERSK